MTFWDMMGAVNSTVAIISVLILLTVFILGCKARIQKCSWGSFSWWLQTFSITVFLFGVVAFAGYMADTYSRISIGAMGKPEILQENIGIAFSRMTAFAVISVIGFLFSLILGKPKEKNRQQMQS